MQYTIGEAAKILGTTTSTLRFYESKGLFPFMLKRSGSTRFFDDLDINWCQLLDYLKASGMSIDTIKRYVDLYVQGDSTIEERRSIVYKQKALLQAELERLQSAMDMINFKIWLYDTAVEGGTMHYARTMPRDKIPPDILKTIDKNGGFQPFYLKQRYAQALKEQERLEQERQEKQEEKFKEK